MNPQSQTTMHSQGLPSDSSDIQMKLESVTNIENFNDSFNEVFSSTHVTGSPTKPTEDTPMKQEEAEVQGKRMEPQEFTAVPVEDPRLTQLRLDCQHFEDYQNSGSSKGKPKTYGDAINKKVLRGFRKSIKA